MKKKPVIFDLDLNLLDTYVLKQKHNQALIQELNVSKEEFQKAVDGYYEKQLESSTDFDPKNFVAYLADKFDKDPEPLLLVYDRDDIYKEALYPETMEVLKLLSEKWKIGVYSEGEENYQIKKLEKSGIIDYLDKGMVFIFKRKKDPKNIDKLPESIVVDDKEDIIEVLKQFPHITPVLIDREGKKKDMGVSKVRDLLELVDLLETLE